MLHVLFNHQGRINRRTYWLLGILPIVGLWVGLFLVIIGIGVMVFLTDDPSTMDSAGFELILNLSAIPVSFLTTYMTLTVFAQRWHDLGKRALWWNILVIVPIVSFFTFWPVLLFLGLKNGQPTANEWGPAPSQALAMADSTDNSGSHTTGERHTPMKCPNCKTEIGPNQRKCPSCGQYIPQVSPTAPRADRPPNRLTKRPPTSLSLWLFLTSKALRHNLQWERKPMRCPKCNTGIWNDQRKCPSCGQYIPQVSPTSTQPSYQSPPVRPAPSNPTG